MNKLKDCPRVLAQKILFTLLIGAGCLAVGFAYFLAAHDRIFLALSGIVLAFSLFRGWTLFRLVTVGKYETVEGTCVGVAAKLFRKQFTVRVMDDEGVETSLRLGKQARVKIGTRYRFYFRQGERAPTNSAFFDSLLANDLFLGFEQVNEDKAEK